MRNRRDGFTLAELVVSVSLVGILMSFAIPAYQSTVLDVQRQTNKTNMRIIKEVFMGYWQEGHMIGNPVFPPLPYENIMDENYMSVELQDGRTVNDLFSGDLPMNSNTNPFHYYTDNDTSATGFVTIRIVIVDEDEDSPSYEGQVIGEI